MIRKRLTTGPRIVKLREEAGYTQSSLAKALGVTQTCVWNWEQGNTFPRPETLKTVARLLKSTPEFLRDGNASDPSISAGPDTSIAEIVEHARELVAAAAGVDPGRVRVTIDF
jgi:transcriptional regulator with XRE-family HTH domain